MYLNHPSSWVFVGFLGEMSVLGTRVIFVPCNLQAWTSPWSFDARPSSYLAASTDCFHHLDLTREIQLSLCWWQDRWKPPFAYKALVNIMIVGFYQLQDVHFDGSLFRPVFTASVCKKFRSALGIGGRNPTIMAKETGEKKLRNGGSRPGSPKCM